MNKKDQASKVALQDMKKEGVKYGVLYSKSLILNAPDVTQRVGLLGLI